MEDPLNYRGILPKALIAISGIGLLVGQAGLPIAAYAQQPPVTPSGAGVTIRAESRLVLVDVVVTDKKGAYVEDLTQNDSVSGRMIRNKKSPVSLSASRLPRPMRKNVISCCSSMMSR